MGGDLRAGLRRTYLPALRRILGEDEASERFGEMLEQVEREEARASGPAAASGRSLLKRERNDSVVALALRRKRAEGVRDEDLVWWRGTSPIERGLVRKIEELRQAHAFLRFREEEGMSSAEATAAARVSEPTFAADGADAAPGDPHRPLPIELWRRVERLLAGAAAAEREALLADARARGSLNAALREWFTAPGRKEGTNG